MAPFSTIKRKLETNLLIIMNEKATVAINRILERKLLDNILSRNIHLLHIREGGEGDIRKGDDTRTLNKHKMNIHNK